MVHVSIALVLMVDGVRRLIAITGFEFNPNLEFGNGFFESGERGEKQEARSKMLCEFKGHNV